jgi:hypothetical protein
MKDKSSPQKSLLNSTILSTAIIERQNTSLQHMHLTMPYVGTGVIISIWLKTLNLLIYLIRTNLEAIKLLLSKGLKFARYAQHLDREHKDVVSVAALCN